MGLYKMEVFKRSAVVWMVFQGILWVVFGITCLMNPDAWGNAPEPKGVVSNFHNLFGTFLFIFGNNLLLSLIIVLGNVFVRFGAVTPGLLILMVQGVMIGSVAGANSFEIPFRSIAEANIQFLKVGLWETTAYALICGVTLTKSLHIADTFPAKQWSEVRRFKELHFSTTEKVYLLVSIFLLGLAAYIEAIYLTRM